MTTVPHESCCRKLVLRLSFETGKLKALQRPKQLGYSWSCCR